MPWCVAASPWRGANWTLFRDGVLCDQRLLHHCIGPVVPAARRFLCDLYVAEGSAYIPALPDRRGVFCHDSFGQVGVDRRPGVASELVGLAAKPDSDAVDVHPFPPDRMAGPEPEAIRRGILVSKLRRAILSCHRTAISPGATLPGLARSRRIGVGSFGPG